MILFSGRSGKLRPMQVAAAFAGLLFALPASASDRVEVRLVADGAAPLPVVVSKNAPERTRTAAKTLAGYLGRMSGAEFRVVTGPGDAGIAVGRPADFPQLALQPPWRVDEMTYREDYLLRSHARGLYVVGATELAVEHAVWDLLYRLGHRQFFPGEAWEIVPRRATLSIAVDVHEHPDFLARRIWYGFGPWDYAAEPYRQWCARNRCTSGVVLNTGHAYDGIIGRNQAQFEAHSEYLGLVDGRRTSTKFCISNPSLRELVVQDALAQLAKNTEQDSVSVDPSDGPGWCECDECRALGSISDRALTLANQVAEAVNEAHPGTYVGMYAYSAHSPPPSIRVHPQVVVSVATAFIRGGYSVDQLMDGWHQKGATLGVREYFSVNTWDRDLPGRSRGSNLDYIATKLPHFYEQGARFFSSESSDNWGPNGLGYYLAARLLWETDDAMQTDALVDDFLETCFKSARKPMAEFYRLIDGANRPLLSDHLIGRMYRLLQEARQMSEDPAVGRRLDDLVLYTRYVELWLEYDNAADEARQEKFEAMIRHVYRMRTTMMVHSKALYRDVDARDKRVAIPAEAKWNVSENRNPWKRSEPFRREELDGFVREGIDNRPLRGFEPATFETDLIPAARLHLKTVSDGKLDAYSRGTRTYFLWIDDSPRQIRLSVTGGRIYKDRGDVKLALRPTEQNSDDELNLYHEPSATALVPPDGQKRTIALKAARPGLHLLTVSDGGAGTAIEWMSGQPLTILSSRDQPADFHGRWSLYFYVPKGTAVVGGYSAGPGTMLDGDGNVVHTFDREPGYFRVPVGARQAGRLWKFDHCAGRRLLMTVPPCLARSADELLLPAGVVQRDERPDD